jgi:hypothetical protein
LGLLVLIGSGHLGLKVVAKHSKIEAILSFLQGFSTFNLTGESILVFARPLQDATFAIQKSAITPKRENVGAA